jgi:putative DNA-invertase from lambdoid prophage Rac
MKVAIYCRVSTEGQTTENQRITLEEYAKRNNWDYEIIEEVESSRKTRPMKSQLLQRLRRKEFNSVLVYKLDRWARSSYELLTDITELTNKGINFISFSDNIDLSTATGKLQFQILSAFAEFERNLIRERTLEGLKRAKKQGKILGRPKGRKDKKERKKGGYYMRYMDK